MLERNAVSPKDALVGDVLPYFGHREVSKVASVDAYTTRLYYADGGGERGDAFTNYWNGMTLVVYRSARE